MRLSVNKEGAVTASDIEVTDKLEIVNLMLAKKVPLILMEVYFDRKDPDFVASKTASKVVVLSPSVGGDPAAKDYISLFEGNVATLVKALSGK